MVKVAYFQATALDAHVVGPECLCSILKDSFEWMGKSLFDLRNKAYELSAPHQGTESQWIEALLFLPISEILSLTWKIVVDPDYTIETFYNFHWRASRELFLLGNISKASGQQELE